MRSQHRRWLTTAAATVGACALTLGGAVLPAAAEDTSSEATTINAGVDKYELAAANSASTVEDVKRLEASGSIAVSDNGFVLHIDDAQDGAPISMRNLRAAPSGAAIPGDPAGGSRPGAPVTVYLDFDGEVLEGTNWNLLAENPSLNFVAAASADGGFRAQVWAAVAEDFAPFNVNVTTTRPSDAALYKTSADDNEYASHVIITDSYDEVLPAAANTSGLAWGGGAGSDFLTGALVFTNGVGGGNTAAASAKSVADTASHEAAHNFGLEHDGIADSPTGEYYYPTAGVWGPIMGATYDVPLSQWSNGSYAGATNDQDDLATITDRGAARAIFTGATTPDGTPYTGSVCAVPPADPNNPQPGDEFYVPNGNVCDGTGAVLTLSFTYTDRADAASDTVGNTIADASTLDNAAGTFAGAGVILNAADVDVFRVTTNGGPLTATVEVADIAPNLDAKLTLTNAAGDVLVENDPASSAVSADVAAGLNASVTTEVAKGTYYLWVDGVGAGDPTTATPANANGYTDYGSLGNYTITGAAVPGIAEQPIVIETPADGATVAGGSDVAVTGTATPEATVELSIAGTVVDSVTVDGDGAWTANATANAYGNTVITASQTVDGAPVPETDSVTVTAPVTAPVIVAPAADSTTEDSTPTISGTGIAGATVTVAVVHADGTTVFATTTVDADGAWELAVPSELANGTYAVSANQAINDVTSSTTSPISFTVSAATTGGGGDDGTGTGTGDDDLATTGGDFSGMLFTALAASVLVIGGGAAAFGLRQRRKQLQES